MFRHQHEQFFSYLIQVFKTVLLTRSWCSQLWEQLSWHFKMNGLVIIFALGFNIHTVHVIIMYQQYVKCYRNKYLYIFQSLANTDQNSLCLPSWHSKKIGEYTQALTFLIKHWEFWLKFDTWSTFACSLYTQIVILCKFGNCINHGVEMLKKLLFYSTKR